jgi:hypothetical protein
MAVIAMMRGQPKDGYHHAVVARYCSSTEYYSILLFFATQLSQMRDFVPAARVTITSHHYCSTVGTTITAVVLSYVGIM